MPSARDVEGACDGPRTDLEMGYGLAGAAACKIPYIAPSLGGVESLIEQPTIVSYWDYGPEQRAKLGIKDNLVRFACGVEDYDDVEADILQALEAI